MPELPEVETIRRTLAPVLVDATIVVTLRGERPDDILLDPWPSFAHRVRGQRIVGLERRGKYLAIRLADDHYVLVHFGMTGELQLARPNDPPARHCHLAFVLRSSRAVPGIATDRKGRFVLRYYDVRRFGQIGLLTADEWSRHAARLGPEPFDPQVDPVALWRQLGRRRAPVKAVLLDQTLLAGIGNIYADEALFRAGIHPLRRCATLSAPEVERLLTALRDVLTAAIQERGTTIRDFRDGRGEKGTYQRQLQVYGKRAGTPCPRCGTPLERVRVGGRSSTACPRCQPLARDAPRSPLNDVQRQR
ncbi:MAG: bifunctional DNA-formamidopyrimidine glycosylase/DNA-(apurinic or apyrimidinic site) lyase [Thermomicrobium sp.]|nr:bifunctional DNA-formamidopyrimidine glycosylase/DNA-(apurinic or apyrimidinic site) lyase [Thermomicrobium sp.]